MTTKKTAPSSSSLARHSAPPSSSSSSSTPANSASTPSTTTAITSAVPQVTSFPPLKIDLRYRVALPELPFEPKFMTIPMSDEYITKYRETTLERSYKYKLHAFPPPLPDCDLIDPFISEQYAKSVVLDERDRLLTRKDAVEKHAVSVRATQMLEEKPWMRKTIYLAPNELRTEGPAFTAKTSTVLSGKDGGASARDRADVQSPREKSQREEEKTAEEEDATLAAFDRNQAKLEKIEREFEIANAPPAELLSIIAKSDNPKLKRKLTVRRTYALLPAEIEENWKRARGMELFQVRFDPGEGLEEDDVAKINKESIEREEHSFLVRRPPARRNPREVVIVENEFTPMAYMLPRLVPDAAGGQSGGRAGNEELALGEEEQQQQQQPQSVEEEDLFADEDAEPIAVPGEDEKNKPRKAFDETRAKTIRDYSVKTAVEDTARSVLLFDGDRVLFRAAQRTTLRMYRGAKRAGRRRDDDDDEEDEGFVPGFASSGAHARGREGNVPVHLRPFSEES